MEHLILNRREAELISRAKGWLLVYEKRKVGKTFLLRREIAWDPYATVTRSRDVLLESSGALERVGLEEGVRRVVETLRGGGCAVVDEFQRLPEACWDFWRSPTLRASSCYPAPASAWWRGFSAGGARCWAS